MKRFKYQGQIAPNEEGFPGALFLIHAPAAQAPRRQPPCFARNTISFIRASIGATTGTVSIVLTTGISSSAVKVLG